MTQDHPPMQTVNFNCPHCGNLMAVGANLLGRNVRCPHCKQVVRAPAAAGEAPAQSPTPPLLTPENPVPPQMPTFNVPEQVEHHESIFGERHDEDVFGSEPPKPVLPSAPPPPPPPPLPTPDQLAETVSVNALTPPPPVPAYDAPTAPTLDCSPPPGGALENRVPEHHPAPATDRPDYGYRSRTREEAPSTPAFAWILLAYSALVTIAAGFFGFQYFAGGDDGAHPYKAMPDVLRHYDPAKKTQVSFQGLPDPKLDIPQDLRVKLGGELVVGDLQVQPVKVERKRLEATTKYVSDPDKTRAIGENLVLTLRVKNLSTDTTFHPNDPAFNRARDTKQELPLPYTGLQIYRDFYYGIFKWPSDPGTEKEFVVGHEDDEKPLGPGEERDTWVTVAGPGIRLGNQTIFRTIDEDLKKADPVPTLLWRVQLRRGLVPMKDESGNDVDVSATTVIGVEFVASQIK